MCSHVVTFFALFLFTCQIDLVGIQTNCFLIFRSFFHCPEDLQESSVLSITEKINLELDVKSNRERLPDDINPILRKFFPIALIIFFFRVVLVKTTDVAILFLFELTCDEF